MNIRPPDLNLPPNIALIIFRYMLNENLAPEEESSLQEWLAQGEENRLLFWMLREDQDLRNGEELRKFLTGYRQSEYRQQDAQKEIEEQVRVMEAPLGAAGIGVPEAEDEEREVRMKPRRMMRLHWWSGFSMAASVCVVVFFYLLRFQREMPGTIQPSPGLAGHGVTLQPGGGPPVELAMLGVGRPAHFGRICVCKTGEDRIAISVDDDGGVSPTGEELPSLLLRTPAGHKLEARMPDSTKLWINAGSALELPAAGHEAWGRTMNLNGEGYFMVRYRQYGSCPLVVTTPDLRITCLGTSFNVRAYPLDGHTRVSLHQGSLMLGKANSRLILRAGQEAVSDQGGLHSLAIQQASPAQWKDGLFDFDNETVAEIFGELERWYGVRIIAQPGVPLNERIHLVGRRSEPLEVILEPLGLLLSVKYHIHNDTVYVAH